MSDFVPPELNKNAFHCPNCGSFSDQFWTVLQKMQAVNVGVSDPEFRVGSCRRCHKVSIWNNGTMIYPTTGNAPLPNSDMSTGIKQDYNEARDIVSRSPRSACVLLRLCIEKICDEKGSSGRDLNEKIGKLVANGLDEEIAKALDSIRVIGGQAVHPLEMDLRDDIGTATALFKIVNYISEWAHSRKKTINDIFDSLPEKKKDAIEKRDSPN